MFYDGGGRTGCYLRFTKWLLLLFWLVAGWIVVPIAAAAAAVEPFNFHLTNDFSVYYNRISGPGRANSILNDGWHYQEVITADGNGGDERITYDFHLGAKSTDDDYVDARQYSLTHATLNLRMAKQTLSLGDTFEVFSQYSLNSAIKGGVYRILGGPSLWPPRFSLVYGRAAPRWDSIWGDLPTRTMNRQVYGTRVAFGSSNQLGFGAHFVGVNDREPVMSFERVYDTNLVYGLDVQYKPISGITLFAEAAVNDGEVRVGSSEQIKEIEGYALKLRVVGDQDPSRVSIEYERIDPQFENPVGAATADREKLKFMWRYTPVRDLQLDTNMLWYRNNLKGQNVDPRSDFYMPEVALGWNHPFQRANSFARLSLSKRIGDQNGTMIKDDHLLNLNYRDRIGFIDMDTNLGYNVYRSKSAATMETNEFQLNTVVRSRFSTGPMIVKPALRLGGWILKNELQDSNDRYHEYSLGLGVELPAANITGNFRCGTNRLDREVGNDSSKWFGNVAVYWRPEFIEFFNRRVLFLQGSVNDFKYENGAHDFREDSIMAGISFTF